MGRAVEHNSLQEGCFPDRNYLNSVKNNNINSKNQKE